MVQRADTPSSDRLARAASQPAPGARRILALALAFAVLPGARGEARGQELAFPGGVLWHLSFDTPPVQLPAFDDHSAYLALPDGSVRAVDHATGSIRWTATAACSVRPASSGRHLVGADGATAWAIDAETGSPAWRRDLGAAAAARPVASPAGALFLTEANELALLSWVDGRAAWKVRLPARVSAPVATGPDHAFVGLEDGRVVAIRLADGATAWTKGLGATILGLTPVGDRVFTGSSDNFLYALKAKDGGQAWRWRTGGDVAGTAVADDRRLYFTSLDAMLRALDRRHGDLRWQRPLGTRPAGGPLLAGTLVIVAGVAPELRAFRSSDGGMTATAPVPGRPLHEPFLAPEQGSAPLRLVLLTAGGHLLALGQTVEPMLVPWDVVPGKKLPPEVLPAIRKY